MLLKCGVGEDSWESFGLQRDPTNQSRRKSVLTIHWKDWCWSWNSSALATGYEELTHWKRPWCWARLKAGGEGDGRRWDGWMASPTWWTWVWASFRSWWWTGKLGVLQSMGSQSQTWLSDWTELISDAQDISRNQWQDLGEINFFDNVSLTNNYCSWWDGLVKQFPGMTLRKW